jgi:hypothetical protein
VALVTIMTQAGYAGNPRYNVVAAALGCVLAGVGVVALARRRGWAWIAAAALAAGVLAFTAGDLSDQVDELRERAARRTQLDALVRAVGGSGAIDACAPARTNQPMKAMLAWRLDLGMERLADAPRAPAAIFSAPPGFRGEPRQPPVPRGFEPVAGNGDWALAVACAGGRELRPVSDRSGS